MGIDHLLSQRQDDLRCPDAFENACNTIRAELNPVVLDIAMQVEKGLTTAHRVKKP